jgi:LysM repeat protein
MRTRVIVYTSGPTRGPDKVAEVIEDASNVGVSKTVNAGSTAFFTLPHAHTANAFLRPLSAGGIGGPLINHIEIQRQDQVGLPWATVFFGLLSDFDANPNDVIWYVEDYLTLLGNSLTILKETYTNVACSTIIQNEVTAAVAESNSQLEFLTMGHIDTTATTMSAISDYKSRLSVLQSAVQVVQAGTTARPIFDITGNPATFTFYANKGQRQPAINLLYGGIVSNFRLLGGFRSLASRVVGVASKTSGATVMFSEQTALSSSVYGNIATVRYYSVLPSQTSLDNMTASDAMIASQPFSSLGLTIKSGSLSPTAISIGDAYPVTIKCGVVNLDMAYYTLWGWSWYGNGDGSEDLLLQVLPELAGISASPPPVATPTPPQTPVTAPVYYTVKRGDTGEKIAQRYGLSKQQLLALNPGMNYDLIRVGQSISVK